MGKRFINFHDPEQHEIFRGIYDINTMINLIIDYDLPPYEAFDVLIQCFTRENAEANIEVLQEKLPIRFFDFLRTNMLLHEWETYYESISHPMFSHVVENGDFDPKYKEGVEVLKTYFNEQ